MTGISLVYMEFLFFEKVSLYVQNKSDGSQHVEASVFTPEAIS